jgi:hypothetical protein
MRLLNRKFGKEKDENSKGAGYSMLLDEFSDICYCSPADCPPISVLSGMPNFNKEVIDKLKAQGGTPIQLMPLQARAIALALP